jgi:hypothetical protein
VTSATQPASFVLPAASVGYNPNANGAGGTTGIPITVSGTHTVLVTVSMTAAAANDNDSCAIAFSLTGATTLAASDSTAFGVLTSGAKGGASTAGGTTIAVTLNSGTTNVIAQYKEIGSTNCTFTTSQVIVQVF